MFINTHRHSHRWPSSGLLAFKGHVGGFEIFSEVVQHANVYRPSGTWWGRRDHRAMRVRQGVSQQRNTQSRAPIPVLELRLGDAIEAWTCPQIVDA